MERPTSTARSWRQIESGSPTTTSTSAIPAPAAAAPRIGRRWARSSSRLTRARRAQRQQGERPAGEGEAAQPEDALQVAEVGGAVQLGRR